MKTEKLSNPYVRGNEGCSVSMIDLLEKINEIIDAMNGEHEPDDIYSEDGRLIAKKDESEDERIRKWLVDYFGSIKETVWIHRDITCGQILSWLEKQKEQKPAEWSDYKDKVNIPYCLSEPEWSEEDEDMLNCCISSIEEAKENRYAYKETDGDTSYDREIAFLKSLRPSWKPSEEQMKALKWWSELPSCSPGLKSLYEDLKKL